MYFKINVERLLQAAISICGAAARVAQAQVQKQALTEAKLIQKQRVVAERQRKAAQELAIAGNLKARLQDFKAELTGDADGSDK